MNETLGRWNFWTMFVGFNVCFLPMHLTGLLGMPRRVYTYNDYGGWGALNLLTSIGAVVFALGVLLFFINVLKSARTGAPAGKNPWDAPSLEWSVPSPPPAYNFSVIPTVASRHPLWEDRLGGDGRASSLDRGMLLDTRREALASTPLDASPDMILEMPQDSLAPVLLTAGLAVIFVGLLLKAWVGAGIGAAIVVVALISWMWPRRELLQREAVHE